MNSTSRVVRATVRTGLRVLSLIGAMAGCATQSAAAQEGGAEAEAPAPTLVAEATQGDVTVRFFVDSEGGLLQTEQGSLKGLASSRQDLEPVARYEYLTGQLAPSELIEAATRARAVGESVTPYELLPHPIYRDGVLAATDIYRVGFLDMVCAPTDRNVQLLNQTAPVSYSKTDVNMWRMGVFVQAGVVLAQGQMDKRDPPVRLLPNQAFIAKYWVDGGKGYRASTYVTLPEGPATFDVCINYHF